MNQAFKEWLLKDSINWTPQQKDEILTKLKHEPESFTRKIAESLDHWALAFVCKTGNALVIYSTLDEATELVQAYKDRFATELANIT